MKKTAKLVNAFKAFEIEMTSEIKGGTGKVTWENGGYCDIDYGVKEVCNVPDSGAKVGGQYFVMAS